MPRMLLTVALFALPLAARAQAADTTLLSGFPFQQGTKSLSFNLPTSGTPSVGIGYFVSPRGEVLLNLFYDFVFSRPAGGGSTVDLGFGFDYRQHLGHVGPVAPFVQGGIGIARVSGGTGATAAGGSATLAFNVGFGAEYLFAQYFSVGGELGTGLSLTNVGGSAGSVGAALTTFTTDLFGRVFF